LNLQYNFIEKVLFLRVFPVHPSAIIQLSINF